MLNTGDFLYLKEMTDIISKAVHFAQNHHQNCDPSHDWWHVERVWKLAKKIAIKENANTLIVELAALLHDIDDRKIVGETASRELLNTTKWLNENNVSLESTKIILKIIQELSFKGAGVETPMSTIEGCCVQDADRLDAIGAIGVARCMAYTGSVNRPLYDPTFLPQNHQSYNEYKKGRGTAINHFYEKLLLLKDRMNTNTGKIIAQKRDKFLQEYLQQFLDEWEQCDVEE